MPDHPSALSATSGCSWSQAGGVLRVVLGLAACALVPLIAGCQSTATSGTTVMPSALPALREGPHEAVIGGVRHWYRVTGTCSPGAVPVVFLHGGPGEGSDRFATLIGPRLEGDLCMVYFDQRGSGRSDRSQDGDYAIPTLVADIEGLRQALGPPRIALVAHSFGVLLALEFAAAHPEHVTRLVLAGGVSDVPAAIQAQCERLAGANPEAHARAVEAAAGSGMPCNIFRALPGPEAEAFFEANMFPYPRTLALLDSVDAASGYENTGELGRALFAGGLLEYRFGGHDRLTMPVLVIAGLLDYQGGREPHRELVRRLPNARLLEYEESGHFMYVEEPDRFARNVVAFLSEPLGRRPSQ